MLWGWWNCRSREGRGQIGGNYVTLRGISVAKGGCAFFLSLFIFNFLFRSLRAWVMSWTDKRGGRNECSSQKGAKRREDEITLFI